MIYSPIWNVENSLSHPQPPGVTLFGKLNHFGPQAKQWLGWPLAMAQLNGFWPKVKPVATLGKRDLIDMPEIVAVIHTLRLGKKRARSNSQSSESHQENSKILICA